MKHAPVYLFYLLGIPEHIAEEYRYVFLAVFVTILLTIVSFWVTSRLEKIPKGKQNVFEFILGGLMDFMEEIMGHGARRFLPLVGTLAFFILTSNLLGLIPGFDSPTANLNATGGCAIVVFFATHYYGIKTHGMSYIKQFTGPIPALTPLIMPIEIISHLVRPVSLSIRLFGNMFGGHLVLASFLGLVPLIVPLPMMAMELFVAGVQTLIFIVLSMIYISLALEEHH